MKVIPAPGKSVPGLRIIGDFPRKGNVLVIRPIENQTPLISTGLQAFTEIFVGFPEVGPIKIRV